jgi:TonB family protein
MNDLSASAPEFPETRPRDRVWRYVLAALMVHVIGFGLVWWSLTSKPHASSGLAGVVMVDLVSLGQTGVAAPPSVATESVATETTPTDATPTETTPTDGVLADRLSTPEAVLPSQEPSPELEQQAVGDPSPDNVQDPISEPVQSQTLSEVPIEGSQETKGAREARKSLDEVQAAPSQPQPASSPEPIVKPIVKPSSSLKPAAPSSKASPPASASPRQEPASVPAPANPGEPASRSDQAPSTAPESGGETANAFYWRNPAPTYPARALRQRVQGTVLLAVQVLASGQTGEIKLESSSGSALLDEAAINTVRTWQFRPAVTNGKPVAQWINVPITFQIQDRR